MARKRQPKPKSAGAHPAARLKRSAWAGVRFREPGRWAAEIRFPGSRCNAKVWIGSFDSDKEAALAYDAAIFCMHGDHPPKGRKFNFPDVPRPDIDEHVREQLSVADIKDVAKKHVIQMAGVLPPAAAENLQLEAAAAVEVEVKVEEAAAGVSAGEGASANGSLDGNGMEGIFEEITSAPFIFDPVELAAMMDLVSDDDN